ncbi:GNAT family N-acetyltransferase [Cellulophaga baltica]|uniref:GNAT family N-acetyltransferase n=1 Tax=Cellulophaga TaxID=104264 RepID=UPI001C07D3F9|nr:MULTISPECIES: GNAT family N-acetyltransferase [Cellulophaga]MBU2996114.1 GNAT family N-acetyltransferase [Cellulophaga baltica]MDO6767509.1 GNAT family N-acetyltransferase [Cellulophaga sp. 1_MG-2023]
MSLHIIPFENKYASNFKDLNIAWIKKYFHVENKDVEILENYEESIIKKGGVIFLAKYNNIIVGCFSFLKINDFTYELGKMAVDENYQGKNIGQQLIQFSITYAQKSKWDKIILYSSTKLTHALYLYKKYGFIEVELEKDLPYIRSDIKMELKLNI